MVKLWFLSLFTFFFLSLLPSFFKSGMGWGIMEEEAFADAQRIQGGENDVDLMHLCS